MDWIVLTEEAYPYINKFLNKVFFCINTVLIIFRYYHIMRFEAKMFGFPLSPPLTVLKENSPGEISVDCQQRAWELAMDAHISWMINNIRTHSLIVFFYDLMNSALNRHFSIVQSTN